MDCNVSYLLTQVRYLQDYAQRLDLNVQLNTEIVQVDRLQDQSEAFHLRDQNGTSYFCSILIVRYIHHACLFL